jgi:di/tricarboxylate transporter
VSDITICFTVLGAVVVLFVWNKLPVEIVALGAALSLYVTGVLTIEQSIAGFGESAVLFIAALFVVSEALDATGVTAWAGQQLIARAGTSKTRLIVFTMLLVALLTAVISVNGAVAALVPMVVVLAVRLGHAPSQLLMPVAFAAHAGSMLALTGTPVSVIVSDAAFDAGAGRFGFFEFTLVGLPLVIGSVVLVVLLGGRLLPNRRPESIPPDLSRLAEVLVDQYDLDRSVARFRVESGSGWIGRNLADLDDAAGSGVRVVGAQGDRRITGEVPLQAGDIVVLRGAEDALVAVASAAGLSRTTVVVPESSDAKGSVPGQLVDKERGLAELVVAPRSELVGTRVFPGMVSESGRLIFLGVRRGGETFDDRETVVAEGDALLVRGTWEALERGSADPGVLVVDEPDLVRRQAVPLGPGARRSMVIVGAMVVLLATGIVPAVAAGLFAAMAIVITKVLTTQQAYRSISWTTVVLVGGMTPLSTAMQQTGAAGKLADGLVNIVGDAGPYALLAGLFLLTAILGQLISNMATALIVIPIAVSAAVELDASVAPVLMAVNVAASAAFLTPVATPANLMVMGPGGYKFGDYWKLGGCLLAFFFVIAVFYVPLVWSL